MTVRGAADPTDHAERPCPACGACAASVLFAQRFRQIEGGSLLSGYDVVVCGRCGCGYADRIPLQAEFDRYYQALSKYEQRDQGGRETAPDRSRFRDIAALVDRFLGRRDGHILEVGCASGGLLACLRDLGHQSLEGVDPSPYCASAAARLYGLSVQTGTLSEPIVPRAPCDMVVLVGVLEHLREVGAALQSVRSLLVPAGRIYVEVPDATRFAEFVDAPFQQFSLEHVGFFSPDSLRRTLRRSGFACVHLEQTQRPHTANSVMPVLAAVFERSDAGDAEPLPSDAATAQGLEAYVEASAAIEANLRLVLDGLTASREPFVVWGVGTHTAHLLETTTLGQGAIVAFVDSNTNVQGKELAGRPIHAPEWLRTRSEPVLISSCVFQNEIAHEIRTRLGCPNRMVLLYPGAQGCA